RTLKDPAKGRSRRSEVTGVPGSVLGRPGAPRGTLVYNLGALITVNAQNLQL
ncbi:hypothetical protein KI387_038780, partial [Taxus chinensis]